ncbi:hypothetical protein CYMTET_32322 [Cymbomonas tetramitiformis]|uniref:Uncharacterized protein n=1 Tax=Cymbomonas tetramitiformis TaxID=36881 RepID=A0AAE0FF98_9CHLO|nr:hypothetical protein CYMTET_32322 [Cymbomonas tetramitiformis]
MLTRFMLLILGFSGTLEGQTSRHHFIKEREIYLPALISNSGATPAIIQPEARLSVGKLPAPAATTLFELSVELSSTFGQGCIRVN